MPERSERPREVAPLRKWRCGVCGRVETGESPPATCSEEGCHGTAATFRPDFPLRY